MKKIVFTGGGSAGHVVPNLALMQELNGYDRYYIGTNGIEKALISKEKYPFYTISCPKFKREWCKENFMIPFSLFSAIREAKKGLKTIQPDLVFSKGSYVSLPVVIGARLMGIPVIVHESDLTMGLANKIGRRFAKRTLTAFPETKGGIFVGNPIRSFHLDREKAKRKYGIENNLPTLLVFGGGSGSKTINDSLRNCLLELTRKVNILHIVGKGNKIQSSVKGYIQIEYETEMQDAYAVADFVLSRAGANTLFELLALKKRALVVPLQKSSRGDQMENANYFEKKGLFRTLKESELSSLKDRLFSLFQDEELKENLQNSHFPTDNTKIISLIEQTI